MLSDSFEYLESVGEKLKDGMCFVKSSSRDNIPNLKVVAN